MIAALLLTGTMLDFGGAAEAISYQSHREGCVASTSARVIGNPLVADTVDFRIELGPEAAECFYGQLPRDIVGAATVNLGDGRIQVTIEGVGTITVRPGEHDVADRYYAQGVAWWIGRYEVAVATDPKAYGWNTVITLMRRE